MGCILHPLFPSASSPLLHHYLPIFASLLLSSPLPLPTSPASFTSYAHSRSYMVFSNRPGLVLELQSFQPRVSGLACTMSYCSCDPVFGSQTGRETCAVCFIQMVPLLAWSMSFSSFYHANLRTSHRPNNSGSLTKSVREVSSLGRS